VKIVAAAPADTATKTRRLGFKPDRIWILGEDEAVADRQGRSEPYVKQILRLTPSPKCMDDVMFDPGRHLAKVADVSPKVRDFFTAMLLADAMHISPLVARVAIDAKKGVAFAANTPKHKNAAGVHLPDCFNVKVPRVDVRKNGIAFTYAPRSLPVPVTPEYKEVEKFYPLTERFNQEIFIVENLRSGTYELAFDGEKVGEFTAEEFEKGVNVANLDTPNQRKAASLVKIAESIRGGCSVLTDRCESSTVSRMEDAYEMINALRPDVSRVTLSLKSGDGGEKSGRD
jgi:hypothetical protein